MRHQLFLKQIFSRYSAKNQQKFLTIESVRDIMSDSFNNHKGNQNIQGRASLSSRMQRGFKKMKKSIQKITETSTSVQAHCVFVENIQDEEKQSRYIVPERLSYLTRQTGFTKDEIRKLYRAFKQHCPRGAVTTNDLKPVYAKLFPLGEPSKYAQIVFNAFDRDRDGIVSFSDLLTEISLITNGDTDQKLSWIFRFYDLNGDGYITRKEMLVIVSAIYEMLHNGQTIQRMIDRHVDKIFKKMDIDKDGVISQEEFMSTCKNDSAIQSQLVIFNQFW